MGLLCSGRKCINTAGNQKLDVSPLDPMFFSSAFTEKALGQVRFAEHLQEWDSGAKTTWIYVAVELGRGARLEACE